MKNKRIAVIAYHTCPLSDEGQEIGGMNIYVLEMSKMLAKKGFIIDIFTRCQDNKSEKIVEVCPNLRVIHLVAGKSAPIEKRKLRPLIPAFIVSFDKFVNEEKLHYDIVDCHYYLSGIIGLAIKATYKIPLFMKYHTLGIMKNLVARDEDETEDIYRIKTEMHLARQSDKIFANSRTEEAYIESLYGARKDAIIILSPGVNVELFHPYDKVTAKKEVGAPLEKKMILFVGRPEPLKGIDTLMYAVKILIEKDPLLSLSLWIVGGIVGKNIDTWSKELKKLESLRRTLSISSNVHFIGRKSQEELPSFYNAADIVVLPSHYESFGITALEAMACGTPVVTTDVTGVADLFDKKHSPLITSAHNPIRLAQKLHNLLTDKKMYEKSSKEVFEKVQDLSWSKIADKYISVVNKCTTRSVL